MSEFRLIPTYKLIETASGIGPEPVSEPERELKCFINSMASLVGPGASESLTEVWLNELACMECVPGSESFNWRLVSLSASARIAGRVIASQLPGPYL
jgi:hypothetical protein